MSCCCWCRWLFNGDEGEGGEEALEVEVEDVMEAEDEPVEVMPLALSRACFATAT